MYMLCVLAVFLTIFLARRTSLSASSGSRHHAPLWLHNTNLGSNIFSMWMNLWLFHCIYGHNIFNDMQRDCIQKAVHQAPFFSYWTQWLNDSANVGCFIVYSYNFAANRGLFEFWRYKTELLMRRCLFRNKLLACCLLCLFFCGKSMWGGGAYYVLKGVHGERC